MSNTIEQRVVEMRFDNKQFESGVSTTLSTLDKLKQKLNLTGASKGLDNISKSAKNVNMSGLGGAVDTVTAKFSALQVMGVTALANITNSAVNAGKNIVKSLTIDPIKSGFSEYETKMGSIQTILANTEHQGTNLDQVTAALDKLNLYADKTIYNFQEMTKNIGTFTAAGVDLDTSVRSIQGIANLAAVSGSTSQQASTAMYQLSQALASGTVKLMDWNSVVNAGMGGKVFQNALIRTAAVMAKSADDVEGWQKKNIDAHGSFRDSLTQGAWLTTDVLTKTLEQFTMAAEEGSDEWEAFKKSLESQGYTSSQAEEILKMANTATDAATKVKTFTQLMDTLKESAQSGWAQTWENIVGDFEEAKEFFTGLSDLFGGIIGDSAERRNNLIEGALGSNWDKMTGKISDAGVEIEAFEEALKQAVGETKFDKLVEEFGSVEKAAKAGKFTSEQFKTALKDLGKAGKESLNFDDMAEKVKGNKFTYSMGGLNKTSEEIKRIQTALNDLGYDISPDGKFGKATYQAVMAFQKAEGIKIDGIVGEETIAALEKATGKTGELTNDVGDLAKDCEELAENMTKPSGRELLLDSIMNVIHAIHRPLAAVGEAFRDIFSLSPEGLYNGLEKISNFTSKLVPKGVLDETTWDGLEAKINALGIKTGDFSKSLMKVLKEDGVDVAKLRDEYGSLANAFDKGAISIEHVKKALLGFDGISESMLIGGENADKLRRAFAGVFAVFKLIGTFAGGGLKVAFNVLTEILGVFGMDVLDLAATMGDALVNFEKWVTEGNLIANMFDNLIARLPGLVSNIKEWFAAFKETPAVQKLVTAINNIKAAFDKLTNGEISISEFATDLGTNLAEALKSLPEIAVQFGKDFIAGFTIGISSAVSDVVGKIINFCASFIEAFASALGIHSPSTITMEMGENVIAGLQIGIQNGVSTFGNSIQGICNTIVQWFKDSFTKLRDWIGNIDFSALFAVGVGTGMIFVVKSIGDALDTLAAPLEGLGSLFEDVGKGTKVFLKGLGSNLKASAWEKRGKAMISFAAAIGILAASLYVLAGIEDTGKLWSAVGAITVLALVIGGLMFALSKLQSTAGEGGGIAGLIKSLNFGAIAAALIGMSVVLLAMAYVVKQISALSPKQALAGFLGLAAMVVAIAAVFWAFGGLVKGKSAQNIGKVGGMLIKMSIALLLLAAVVKLVGKLSPEEMAKGGEFLSAFLLFTAGLAFITQFAGKGFNKLGGMMLKMSAALLLLVGVVKLVGTLSPAEAEKGIVFAGAFLAFVAILATIGMIPGTNIDKLGSTLTGIAGAMLILVIVAKLVAGMECRDMTKAAVGILGLTVIIALLVGIVDTAGKDAPKIAMTLLAMSVAIGILAGVAIMLSLVDLGGLAKGIIAIGLLSACMALMIAATRGANDVKGSLIVMTVAIGLMAAAVAALSLIDPSKLAGATIALGMLMGMFALITYSSQYATGSMGVLIVITGVVAILAGILWVLSSLPVDKSIGTAVALSALMLALSVSLAIMGNVKSISPDALIAMGAIALIIVSLGVILGLLEMFDLAPSMETVTALSTMLLAMSATCLILCAVGAFAPAALTGALTLVEVMAGIGAFMVAVGALMTLMPDMETFANDGIRLLETIAFGIGSICSSLLEGFTDGLPAIAEDLTNFMSKLQGFIDGITNLDDSFAGKAEALVTAVGAIVKASIWESLSSWVQKVTGSDDPMAQMVTKLTTLGEGLNSFATTTSGITPETITPVVEAAEKLMGLKPSGDGLFDNDGIDNFGADLEAFGTSLQSFATSTSGITTESITPVVDAATKLAGITIPDDGFFGGDGIDNFGKDISKFGEKMAEFATAIAGVTVDTTVVDTLMGVATDLATLTIPDDGMFGGDGIDNFGSDIKTFADKLVEYSNKAAEIDYASVVKATLATNKIIGTITSTAGIDTSGVESFKNAVAKLATVDLSGIASSFSGAAESMASAGASIIDAIASGMKTNQAAISDVMKNIVSTLQSDVTSANGEFNSAGVDLITKLAEGISSKESAPSDKIKSALDTAKTTASGYYDSFRSIGSSLAEGLAAGIRDMASTVAAEAAQMVIDAEAAARAEAEVNSPSKLFRRLGTSIPEGFAQGIDKYSGAVKTSSVGMVDTAMKAVSNTISRISDAINSDIDAQPTIRPVLDLSDVRSGAGAISSLLDSNPALMSNLGAINTMMNRRSQNGANNEVVSAITKLRRDLANMPRESYNINGVTYDDGSNIKNFAEAVVHQARLERRV